MPKTFKKATLFRILFLILLITLIIVASIQYRHKINVTDIHRALEHYGFWAPLFFIALYAIATVLFLPGSILTITGGFIFGPYFGTLYNLTGAVIGSSLAFLIARYIASDWVAEKAGGRLRVLIKGVEQEGWRFVAIVRLVPLIPFNLLNYALGLTKIRIIHYVLASALFMLPGTFAYTFVGSLGQTALAGEVKEIVTKALIAVGLLVLVGAIPWFIKRMRKIEYNE